MLNSPIMFQVVVGGSSFVFSCQIDIFSSYTTARSDWRLRKSHTFLTTMWSPKTPSQHFSSSPRLTPQF
jgi:hypothetical protein